MAVHERLLRGDGPPRGEAARARGHARAAARAARRRQRAPPVRRPRRPPRRARGGLGRGAARRPPPRAAGGRAGHRQVAARRGVHARRARGRRRRALRPLRRDGAGRLPARAGDAARLVGRRGAHRPGPAARPARGRPRRPAAGARGARDRRASTASPATDRQRLFDALAALLAELAAGAPLLLVFDDLHWADSPTVQLLRHLVRAPQPRRTMFLGTYRDAELEDGHPLPELIASLRREDILTQVTLDGLERGEVGELMQAMGVDAPLLRPRLGAARRDRGQPVLRRGGHAPPARHARRARGPRSTSSRRACPRACARSPRGGSCGCRRRRARPSRWRR